MAEPIQIGILLYPNVTQLDATGPAQVLSRVPGAKMQMIWKTLDPVPTDAGFSIVPTTTFADCPQLDVICVPGGGGQVELMVDPETLDFLRKQAATARYVTSVCTGSLVLGAAGLLKGYKSACHWAWRDMLKDFGAIPVAERVVRDRNRISARARPRRPAPYGSSVSASGWRPGSKAVARPMPRRRRDSPEALRQSSATVNRTADTIGATVRTVFQKVHSPR